ncbi:hypothetical protein ES707_17712 [subsurface metagenome]
MPRTVDRGDIATGGGDRGGGFPLPPNDDTQNPPPRPAFGLLPRPEGRGQCVAIATGKPFPGVTVDATFRGEPGGVQQRLKLAGINRNSLHPYGKLAPIGACPPRRDIHLKSVFGL